MGWKFARHGECVAEITAQPVKGGDNGIQFFSAPLPLRPGAGARALGRRHLRKSVSHPWDKRENAQSHFIAHNQRREVTGQHRA
jgi:hypothetical protein